MELKELIVTIIVLVGLLDVLTGELTRLVKKIKVLIKIAKED